MDDDDDGGSAKNLLRIQMPCENEAVKFFREQTAKEKRAARLFSSFVEEDVMQANQENREWRERMKAARRVLNRTREPRTPPLVLPRPGNRSSKQKQGSQRQALLQLQLNKEQIEDDLRSLHVLHPAQALTIEAQKSPDEDSTRSSSASAKLKGYNSKKRRYPDMLENSERTQTASASHCTTHEYVRQVPKRVARAAGCATEAVIASPVLSHGEKSGSGVLGGLKHSVKEDSKDERIRKLAMYVFFEHGKGEENKGRLECQKCFKLLWAPNARYHLFQCESLVNEMQQLTDKELSRLADEKRSKEREEDLHSVKFAKVSGFVLAREPKGFAVCEQCGSYVWAPNCKRHSRICYPNNKASKTRRNQETPSVI
uniref:Uncharacterized protein n=1 Tax=Timspurckia oligopyrenoides TaxID=708627 RepID=A0A7S0ZGJ6_9RHOD|mmetsp:Transcript_4154/g.7295  ORF Transcript_4154/g.7295 Transcript_4154/m.7295 type:complete len:371 (+) Transcript_4154:146-1258(+)